MWIIIVSDDQSESRNTVLDSLLENNKPIENYLSNLRSHWSSSASINFAKVWKTESGAKKILKLFESQKDSDWRKNKFYYIKSKHLHIRKMTKEEWNSIIDNKIRVLESSYLSNKIKLERKKII